MKNAQSLLVFIFTLSGCASMGPHSPPVWSQPTRTVDNGYIVYVGSGEAPSMERAQVMAEGRALEDMANECSMIPKGTRIEDRVSDSGLWGYTAYVKLAVTFEECDVAMRTTDPTEIREIANIAFTQQLKRYQDLMETGELQARNEIRPLEPSAVLLGPPILNDDPVSFYTARQHVAYQKEIVVLSSPTSFQPASAERLALSRAIEPATTQLRSWQRREPTIRTRPWSEYRRESGPSPRLNLPPTNYVRPTFPSSNSSSRALPSHAPIPTPRPLYTPPIKVQVPPAYIPNYVRPTMNNPPSQPYKKLAESALIPTPPPVYTPPPANNSVRPTYTPNYVRPTYTPPPRPMPSRTGR